MEKLSFRKDGILFSFKKWGSDIKKSNKIYILIPVWYGDIIFTDDNKGIIFSSIVKRVQQNEKMCAVSIIYKYNKNDDDSYKYIN